MSVRCGTQSYPIGMKALCLTHSGSSDPPPHFLLYLLHPLLLLRHHRSVPLVVTSRFRRPRPPPYPPAPPFAPFSPPPPTPQVGGHVDFSPPPSLPPLSPPYEGPQPLTWMCKTVQKIFPSSTEWLEDKPWLCYFAMPAPPPAPQFPPFPPYEDPGWGIPASNVKSPPPSPPIAMDRWALDIIQDSTQPPPLPNPLGHSRYGLYVLLSHLPLLHLRPLLLRHM